MTTNNLSVIPHAPVELATPIRGIDPAKIEAAHVMFNSQLRESFLASCRSIAESGVTGYTQAEQVFAVGLTALELDIPLMTALRTIYVLPKKGGGSQIVLKEELALALVMNRVPGAICRFVAAESNDRRAVWHMGRPGMEVQTFSYTIEQAQRAGLSTREAWQKDPESMLKWRAFGSGRRTVFPDVATGLPTILQADEYDLLTDGSQAATKPKRPAKPADVAVEVKPTKPELGPEHAAVLSRVRAFMDDIVEGNPAHRKALWQDICHKLNIDPSGQPSLSEAQRIELYLTEHYDNVEPRDLQGGDEGGVR